MATRNDIDNTHGKNKYGFPIWTQAQADFYNALEVESSLHINAKDSMRRMTQAMVVKYLRKYDLGKGKIFSKTVNHRYHKDDVNTAYAEMLANEPRNEKGEYLQRNLAFHQSENNL